MAAEKQEINRLELGNYSFKVTKVIGGYIIEGLSTHVCFTFDDVIEFLKAHIGGSND